MKQIVELAEQVQARSGLDEFTIIGGNVIDVSLGKPLNPGDVDLIVRTDEKTTSTDVAESLSLKGFNVSELRTYYVLGDKAVQLCTATAASDQFKLDMAFTDEPLNILGPLDALSMYYPAGNAEPVDDYGCLDAIDTGVFDCLPYRNFSNENPFIILSLLMRACAKYDAPLLGQTTILDEFNQRKVTHPTDTPFLSHVKGSVKPNMIKALLKAKDRVEFVSDIFDSEAMTVVFDDVQGSLKHVLGSREAAQRLREAEGVQEITAVIDTPADNGF